MPSLHVTLLLYSSKIFPLLGHQVHQRTDFFLSDAYSYDHRATLAKFHDNCAPRQPEGFAVKKMQNTHHESSSQVAGDNRCPLPASEQTPLLKPQGTNGAPRASSAIPNQEIEESPVADLSFNRVALILSITLFGCFLSALDSTVVAMLSGPIPGDLEASSLLSWLATAYLIPNSVCLSISGSLTDVWGRGPGLVFSNLAFALGNSICALARDKYTIIMGRAVAGIGGGGLLSIAYILCSDLIPLRRRGIVQGISTVCYGTGGMAGAVIGGLLNDGVEAGWRLAFLVQVPPALISAVAVYILVKVPEKQSDTSNLSRIDFTGIFLSTLFLVLLLLGLSSGGNLLPWSHPFPIAALLIAVACLAGFISWEIKAPRPIIPMRLLMDRSLFGACFAGFFANMGWVIGMFYAPLFL